MTFSTHGSWGGRPGGRRAQGKDGAAAVIAAEEDLAEGIRASRDGSAVQNTVGTDDEAAIRTGAIVGRISLEAIQGRQYPV